MGLFVKSFFYESEILAISKHYQYFQEHGLSQDNQAERPGTLKAVPHILCPYTGRVLLAQC